MKNIIEMLEEAAALLKNPNEETQRKDMLVERIENELKELTSESMTGLLVSIDHGLTWVPSSGVRAIFHDANEDDDDMQDLLVNITTEGVILDVMDQGTGEVASTACIAIEDLIGMTK